MSKVIHYFGTDLTSYGHYFWTLFENRIGRSNINFSDIPFNPEKFFEPYKSIKGEVVFLSKGGWSVCAICGSCKDQRPGTKSVFFVQEDLTNDQLIERIKSTPIAEKIINQMPFEVKWPEVKTESL